MTDDGVPALYNSSDGDFGLIVLKHAKLGGDESIAEIILDVEIDWRNSKRTFKSLQFSCDVAGTQIQQSLLE